LYQIAVCQQTEEPPTNETQAFRTYGFQQTHYRVLWDNLDAHFVPWYIIDSVAQFMQTHVCLDEISNFHCRIYKSLTQTNHLWVVLEWIEGGGFEIVCLTEVETDGFCNTLIHSGMGKQSCAEGKRWILSALGWSVSSWDALESLFLAVQYAAIEQRESLELAAKRSHWLPGLEQTYILTSERFNS
jgi:hypothetical protein